MVGLCAAALFWTMNTQDPQRDPALEKANAAVRAAIPAAAADPERPLFHYHAPAQWMNDPNGPIFYKGWYHMFYQHNPYGDRWEHMHWGHARSRDLVHWEDLPIALWPSLSKGERHVFSGSVFPVEGGKPVAFYTSIGDGREPEQWIATTEDDDLLRWRKDPVRITQNIHGDKPLAEWRDPFLFNDFGLTYMLIGGGVDGKGIVGLYKATNPDLRHWQYLGPMFTHPDADVRNIECPNIAFVDGKWVLLVSVHGRVEAFVGELRNTQFVTEKRSVLADGSYASQLFQGVNGRTIHSAWVNTGGHKGWNGFLTLPSELRVRRDGTLLRVPVKELTKLRKGETKLGDTAVTGGLSLPQIGGESLELEMTLLPGSATKCGVRFRSGAIEVAYEPSSRQLSVPGRFVVLSEATVAKGVKLRIFLDRTTVDVYAADGEGSLIAHRENMKTAGDSVELFSDGGETKFRSLKAWRLAP
ncbi:glycoside hydrolase family 32 protein [bacterium]|nr:MAG: glycoside hydrolase family 32 protein [bacterium]